MKKYAMILTLALSGCVDYQFPDELFEKQASSEKCYRGHICGENAAGLEAIKNFDCVYGDINLKHATRVQLEAVEHLREIHGTLNISYSEDIEVINMPQLSYVRDIIDISFNNYVQEIVFEKLESATKLFVWGNRDLDVVDAPLLSSLTENLLIVHNPKLDTDEICLLLDGLEVYTTFQTDAWRSCE